MPSALRIRLPRAAAVAALAALAAGCSISSSDGSISEQLGLSQNSPDEFLIISSEPLQMPPSLSALPEPRPGATSRVERDPLADARSAVMMDRDGAVQVAAASTGEQALLGGAGATGDNAGIREAIAEDRLPDGERKFGLTQIMGVAVPAEIEDFRSVLASQEENEALRQEGLPTPAAPPIKEDEKPTFEKKYK